MDLRILDPKTAPEADLIAYYTFTKQLQAERQPDEPHNPFKQFLANLRNIPSVYEMVTWLLWNGELVVGKAEVGILTTGENEHLAQVDIAVVPDYRRQGLGTSLLWTATRWAQERGRTVLMLSTWSSVPAGDAFLRRVGADAGFSQLMNELAIADLDPDLLRQWIERAEQRAAGFRLELQEGPWPEDRLEEVAAMMDAMNLVPTGDLQVEDMHFTPEMVRSMDETRVARGVIPWTYVAREMSTGTIAGFTELMIMESRPDKLEQGLTAVFPEYRNKGLGRWLKAAMLEKALADQPQAKKVVTGNADTNEAMLSINNALGFRPSVSMNVLQVPVERVEAFVAERGSERFEVASRS